MRLISILLIIIIIAGAYYYFQPEQTQINKNCVDNTFYKYTKDNYEIYLKKDYKIESYSNKETSYFKNDNSEIIIYSKPYPFELDKAIEDILLEFPKYTIIIDKTETEEYNYKFTRMLINVDGKHIDIFGLKNKDKIYFIILKTDQSTYPKEIKSLKKSLCSFKISH